MVLLFSFIFPGLHYCLWFTVLEWTKFLEFLLGLFSYSNMSHTHGSVNICENLVNFRMCLLQICIKQPEGKNNRLGLQNDWTHWELVFGQYLFFTKTFISFHSDQRSILSFQISRISINQIPCLIILKISGNFSLASAQTSCLWHRSL